MGADPLMAGNSQRRGRTTGAGKKTATAGTGGKNRRSLAGRGATPPAEARPGHPAQRRARRRAAAAGRPCPRPPACRGGARAAARPQPGRRGAAGADPGDRALRRHRYNRRATDERIAEAVQLAADRGLPLLEVRQGRVRPDVRGALHQGIGLQVPPYDYAHPDDLLDLARDSGRPPLIVAMDGVTDPRNLGAVVRSAAAFDAHGVVVPQRRAVGMTASAWRTSAGAAARIPVARAVNLARALGLLPGRGPADRRSGRRRRRRPGPDTTGSPTRSRSSSAPRAPGCRGWCASAATSSSASRSTATPSR